MTKLLAKQRLSKKVVVAGSEDPAWTKEFTKALEAIFQGGSIKRLPPIADPEDGGDGQLVFMCKSDPSSNGTGSLKFDSDFHYSSNLLGLSKLSKVVQKYDLYVEFTPKNKGFEVLAWTAEDMYG